MEVFFQSVTQAYQEKVNQSSLNRRPTYAQWYNIRIGNRKVMGEEVGFSFSEYALPLTENMPVPFIHRA